jgi:hypothetical protein
MSMPAMMRPGKSELTVQSAGILAQEQAEYGSTDHRAIVGFPF